MATQHYVSENIKKNIQSITTESYRKNTMQYKFQFIEVLYWRNIITTFITLYISSKMSQ